MKQTKIEKYFWEAEERRLEDKVKLMRLEGKNNEAICRYLSKMAGHYLNFLDKYCNNHRYKKDGGKDD